MFAMFERGLWSLDDLSQARKAHHKRAVTSQAAFAMQAPAHGKLPGGVVLAGQPA